MVAQNLSAEVFQPGVLSEIASGRSCPFDRPAGPTGAALMEPEVRSVGGALRLTGMIYGDSYGSFFDLRADVRVAPSASASAV